MKKVIIIVTIVLMIFLIILNINNKENKNEIKDSKISIMLETEEGNIETNTFPNKEEYIYDKVLCKNTNDNVNATFNEETWKLNLSVEKESIDGDFQCNIYFMEKKEYNFDYTGSPQTFTVPYDGTYKIELWGATREHVENSNVKYYYLGSYTSGEIELDKNENLYIYVGEKSKKSEVNGTFNGGGSSTKGTYGDGTNRSQYYQNYPGAGATDVRLVSGTWNNFGSLKSRIIVAAGTGGAMPAGITVTGSCGGGLMSRDSILTTSTCTSYPTSKMPVYGATQTSGGYGAYNGNRENVGTFGKGGNGENQKLGYGSSGGGGGYYGGGGGYSKSWLNDLRCTASSSTGGSSFISGHNGCDAIDEVSTSSNIIHTSQSIHYSGKKFLNTVMIDGYGQSWNTAVSDIVSYPNPLGGFYVLNNDMGRVDDLGGFSGNGYAKITLISLD